MPSPRGVRVAASLCSMTSTSTTTSCRPREGCGLHQTWNNYWDSISKLPSPRGVRVASSEDCCCYRRFWLPSPRGVRVASPSEKLKYPHHQGCRPREGCGLHQQKDTNPYQHICRFHTTRRLSITQGQQKMQGVLCLLYRKRECNLIVGSANRLFLRDKNAREKQRLAGNC